MSCLLTVKNVKKYYENKLKKVKAVDGISFFVEEGDYIGIMGASGSGKTTLLNCIATIDEVTEGKILLDGTDITQLGQDELSLLRKEKLGFVFQDFNLLDNLTAYENISLALSIRDVPVCEIDERINDIAKHLMIEEILTHYPYQLSGGQKQRVAAARAIITNPKIILADEPTGALDSKAAKTLMECFSFMNQSLRATILMVTHDAVTASYCNKVLFMKDGKILVEIERGNQSRKDFLFFISEKIMELETD